MTINPNIQNFQKPPYKYNPVVKTTNIDGTWIKLNKRHKNMHFLMSAAEKTLCGISVSGQGIVLGDGIKACVQCEKNILNLEPAMRAILMMEE